jgi:hypothetical protein
MNELVWRRAAEDVLSHGWGAVRDLDLDPVGREFNILRQRALTQFWELMREGALSDVETQTGQYGLTPEADEGDLGLTEVRGHYVFNLGIPNEHPLVAYSPWFYGGEVVVPRAATEFAAARSGCTESSTT